MLTNKHLLLERTHQLGNGIQRIYRFDSGYGLSVVNPPMLYSYPFAWEIAVLNEVDTLGNFKSLNYSTPLTKDVVVCSTDNEANVFIELASRTLV